MSLLSIAVKLKLGAVADDWLNETAGEFKVIGPGTVPSPSIRNITADVIFKLFTESLACKVKFKTWPTTLPGILKDRFTLVLFPAEPAPFAPSVVILTS